MKRWNVRIQAQIDEVHEVEAETEEEAAENVHLDWSFVEAHSWETEVLGCTYDGEDDE